MDLDSVRHVKHELRAVFDEAVRRRGRTREGEPPPRVAFGVAPGPQSNGFRVAVRARSPEDLPSDLDKEIRRAAAGEVDVRFTGPVEVRPAAAGTASPRLAVGASIGHYRCRAGTLGFFGRRNSDGTIGIVSNNHVLAVEDRGNEDDDVLHPAPADRGRKPDDVVARLDGRYPRLRQSTAFVDCAFAPILDGFSYDPRLIIGSQRLAGTTMVPETHRDVCKVGRTTGLTYGRITAFEFEPFDIDYTFGSVRFEGQIEIESVDGKPFSQPGDSGSLVFSYPSRYPVGLVFARAAAGGQHSSGLTYANPIDAVLSALDITFLT